MSLVSHLASFSGGLRAAGVRVATGDEVDALSALVQVDVGDVAEVRAALRCTLKIRPRDAAAFERLFAEMWLGHEPAIRSPSRVPPVAGWGPGGPPRPTLAGLPAPEVPEAGLPGASPEALLRRKPFEECDERDLAELEPLIARMAERLATRRSRRLVPSPARGRADLRRSLRKAVGTGGELLRLAWRVRPVERPRLVFLCDTSGSMAPHARFLLLLARALARVARGTEVFAFNTELVRVTGLLTTESGLRRLPDAVPDWAGGTRIGECLDAFATRYAHELVDSRTVVIVMSDGLDRGDPALIATALRRVRARARSIVWLNPLCADPRYEPTARGMAAALPHVDRLAPVSDLASLERFVMSFKGGVP